MENSSEKKPRRRHDDSECVPENVPAREKSGFKTVALIGNANTGKTTLFNSLTGLRQHVGNYPGVTVSKYSGPLKLVNGEKVELVDLPGIYSLAATSLDERVVIDVLSGQLEETGNPPPDAIVCVANVNNLRRNLFLATQVADLGIPVVLALNQIDVARRDGLVVDTDLLRSRLGVPVIAISARKGEGIEELKQAISDALKFKATMKKISWNAGTRQAIDTLRAGLSAEHKSISDAELQRLIFDVASPLANRLRGEDIEHVGEILKQARARIRAFGENPHSTEALQRYEFIREILDGATRTGARRATLTSALDKILLHRVFGFIIFIALMYGVFYSLYTLSGIPMNWIEENFGMLGEWVGAKMSAYPVAKSLVVDGAIAGVGSVLVFLPQILILFFFLGLLESTGYMARAAFLMDRLLGWCGLNGKSFVPMLSGFACGIPGIMGARTIEDPKARLATILTVPFMSCGARMPVYVLMCAILGRLTNPSLAATVFVCMYLVGIAVAIPVAWIYTHVVMKSKAAPFVLEMPRYQLPRVRDVALRVWQSGVAYTKRAGTIIFAVNIIVWALLFFPHGENAEFKNAAKNEFVSAQATQKNLSPEQVESLLQTDEKFASAAENAVAEACLVDSYLGRFGRFCQPVFEPCGFDWRITIGVLASFPAREGIVATLGTIFSLGRDSDEESAATLQESMMKTKWEPGTAHAGQPVFTASVVVGIMIFFALCGQCFAEIVVIARESSWKWACVAWVQMTALAWIGAVLAFKIGALF